MKYRIDFKKNDDLIPVIIQEEKTGVVLMLGYMNREAFVKTNKKGFVYFFSRSRNKLWMKGETSGNKLKVKTISADCDKDTLLIQVALIGNAVCHKGTKTCFSESLYES